MSETWVERLQSALQPLALRVYRWCWRYDPEAVIAAWRESAEESKR